MSFAAIVDVGAATSRKLRLRFTPWALSADNAILLLAKGAK